MRLKVHIATANEELEGYEAIAEMQTNYNQMKESGTYDDKMDLNGLASPVDNWASKVIEALGRIFPTQLEINLFSDPEIPLGMANGDYNYSCMLRRCRYFVRELNNIRLQSLPEYTDLPLEARIYVEDIDSFRKVRDVNPAVVMDVLEDGYFSRSEDFVQTALERILSVPFHKKDWGGEQNDLYTANVLINGARHETAFLLKGNGLRVRAMEIKHCGANGDQLLRLCSSQQDSMWFSMLAGFRRP